jgi:hypothetical protein
MKKSNDLRRNEDKTVASRRMELKEKEAKKMKDKQML